MGDRDVQIIVVEHNDADNLRRLIEALNEDGTSPVSRLVIVHNGEVPELELPAQATFAVVRLEVPNDGFAPAVNRGLEHIDSRHPVLLLNPDTRPFPGAIRRLRQTLDMDPTVVAVTPRIVDEAGRLDGTCGRRGWGVWEVFCEVFGLRHLPVGREWFGRYRMEAWDHNDRRPVPVASGAALLIRAGELRAGRGLDTTIPMYYEDLELCYRLSRRGTVILEPEATVVHIRAASSSRSPIRHALAVMEEGDARWLDVRARRGWLAAAAVSAVTGLGQCLRWVRASAIRDHEQRAKAAALIRWSMARKPMMTAMPRS